MNTYTVNLPQQFLRGIWNLVRLPILALLVILEPVVSTVCTALALFGVLATIFFKAIAAPHFPMWTMLAISLGFAFVLMIYDAAIRFFSR